MTETRGATRNDGWPFEKDGDRYEPAEESEDVDAESSDQ